MGVVKRGRRVHASHVRLGEAIQQALAGRSQRWLADRLDIDPSNVTRLVKGQVPNVSLEQVRRIEDSLGLRRGELLRAGGYVEAGPPVYEAVMNDSKLDAAARTAVLAVYDALSTGS